ncbi:MAG: muramidase [Flexibacter sp. CG_4_10_14_3_um_filter_32_15]|nr:MAG: muramidase [Flexibacter sp. CG_4_10_14_3_um_filter_32_15]
MMKQLIILDDAFQTLNAGRHLLSHTIDFEIPYWKKRTQRIHLNIRITDRWLMVIIAILLIIIGLQWWIPRNNSTTQIDNMLVQMPSKSSVIPASMPASKPINDVLSYIMTHLEDSQNETPQTHQEQRDNFLVQKQLLITKYLIENKASRLDKLSDEELLNLNKEITRLFVDLVLNNVNAQKHVYKYFTDNTDLNKIETSLMEQAKFHVPASIKLAQSALETAYGQRIVDNNYFGIKDKNRKSSLTTTTEYYTALEMQANKSIIMSSTRVVKNGKTLYKCIVKDHFAEYNSPWHSFRSHSVFLSTNKRYSPLFTKGKNYEDWADKIGSTKYGGVGYATSPIYGELLKKIIKRYHLDLLDF